MSFDLTRSFDALAHAHEASGDGSEQRIGENAQLMARAVRRRRATRQTTRIAVAACLVAAVTLGATQLPRLGRDSGTLPAVPVASPSTTVGATGTCGEPRATAGRMEIHDEQRAQGPVERSDARTDDIKTASGSWDVQAALDATRPSVQSIAPLAIVGIRDDEVVATSGPLDRTTDARTSTTVTTVLPLTDCTTGVPLSPGDLELHALVKVVETAGASGLETSIVAVELDRLNVAAVAVRSAENLACGAVAPPAQAEFFDPDFSLNSWIYTAARTDRPRTGAADIHAHSSDHLVANVPTAVSAALIDSSGRVVGHLESPRAGATVHSFALDVPIHLSESLEVVPCTAGESLSGTMTARPYAVLTVKEQAGPDGEIISPLPAEQTRVVLASSSEVVIGDVTTGVLNEYNVCGGHINLPDGGSTIDTGLNFSVMTSPDTSFPNHGSVEVTTTLTSTGRVGARLGRDALPDIILQGGEDGTIVGIIEPTTAPGTTSRWLRAGDTTSWAAAYSVKACGGGTLKPGTYFASTQVALTIAETDLEPDTFVTPFGYIDFTEPTEITVTD